MDAFWIWGLLTILMVVAEMFSGTFYLLAVAIGLGAAALAAYLGMAWAGQVVTAALICSASVAGIYVWRRGQGKPKKQSNLAYDIGQSVRITSWKDERHARVMYRGAEWESELFAGAVPDAAKETWRIKEIVGSLLIIE